MTTETDSDRSSPSAPQSTLRSALVDHFRALLVTISFTLPKTEKSLYSNACFRFPLLRRIPLEFTSQARLYLRPDVRTSRSRCCPNLDTSRQSTRRRRRRHAPTPGRPYPRSRGAIRKFAKLAYSYPLRLRQLRKWHLDFRWPTAKRLFPLVLRLPSPARRQVRRHRRRRVQQRSVRLDQ